MIQGIDGRTLLVLIDDNRRLVILLCVLALLAGAWLTYGAYVAPGTTTEERTVASWSTQDAFHHSAEVQRDTSVYPAGTRLENRSVYFTGLTPELEGMYVLSAPDAPPATAETTLRLELSATHDRETVLWKRTEHLATETGEIDSGPHRVAFTLNVSAVQERVSIINDELEVSPRTTEIAVVAETRIAGDEWTTTRRDELVVAPDGGVYSLDHRSEGTTSHSRTETVTVAREPGPLHTTGGPLLGLLGLLGLLTLGVLRAQDAIPLDPDARRSITQARQRGRFDEWISEGRVPPSDAEVVRMDSLTDLVDVAIDSDRRVIESDDRFYVLLGDTRYVFDPDSSAIVGQPARSDLENADESADQVDDGATDRAVASGDGLSEDSPRGNAGSTDDGRLRSDGGSDGRSASSENSNSSTGGSQTSETPESERS